jgi:peptidyl-prolyl cis-trans isomerase SurA
VSHLQVTRPRRLQFTFYRVFKLSPMAAPIMKRSRSFGACAAIAAVASLPFGALAAQTPAKPDSAKPPALMVNRIVAVVNDVPITMSDVLDRVIRMRDNSGGALDSAEVVALQQQAREELIDEQVVLQKAKVEKIEVDEADVKQAVDGYIAEVRQRFGGSDAELAKALRESGFGTLEEFRKGRADEMRKDMIQNNFMRGLKEAGRIPAVPVTEAEITAEFDKAKATLPKRKASVSMRQIVFPIEPSEASKRRARAKIDSIAKELEAHPEDFENQAKRWSQDGSAQLGGDLGWNRRGVMVPEFERVMFALNPGIVSPVVETQFGFHLIRVDRVQPSEVKSRHILIKFTVDSTDEARALKLADSVATVLRAGTNFDSVSSRFHDSKNEEERNIPDIPIDTLPLSYQNAVKGHVVNDIVGPFTIQDERSGLQKPVIIQITDLKEAGDYTVSEWRQRIRQQMTEYRSRRRFVDGLRNDAYIWLLEEPKVKGDLKGDLKGDTKPDGTP